MVWPHLDDGLLVNTKLKLTSVMKSQTFRKKSIALSSGDIPPATTGAVGLSVSAAAALQADH